MASRSITDRPAFLRVLATVAATVLTLCAIAFAVDLPSALGVSLFTEQYLAFVFGSALTLAYLTTAGPSTFSVIFNTILAGLGLVASLYIAVRYPDIVNELVYKPLDGLIISVILMVLTIEAVRRLTGWGLTAIVILFILYALVGHLLPFGMTRQTLWDRLAIYIVMDTNGLLGLPLMVSSVTVFAFIIMGQLLLRSGGGAFFNDLALSLVGRRRGGAAKIAVVSSFFFGSVSGSAVANVAASGVVTLPLMRRAGYQPKMAAAVEALASTGGQLAPPIMGAAAFLMAEFLQISYGTVVLAAIVPSALYYLSIYFYVDNHAAKTGLQMPEDVEIRPLGKILREGWQFLAPFALLIYALFGLNWRPELAACASALLLAVFAIVLPYRGQRSPMLDLLRAIPESGKGMIEIVVISAAAGMVIGVLNISGLSFSLTLALVQMAKGSLILLLIVAALVSLVLGMGMPTVGVYVLLASLIGPALVQAGVNPIAAHMFLLYFGMLSMITPPVALASFTAATIAGSRPMETGFAAVRMGWVSYLIPFVMVLDPGLVMVGSWFEIVRTGLSALVGVWFMNGAIYGFLRRPLVRWERAVLVVAAVVAIVPMHVVVGVDYVPNLVALIVGFATVFSPTFLQGRALKSDRKTQQGRL
ncbi:TRAP transporter permease [Sulfitobacter sp. HI0023]|uniref:TRAP transporter permease n=2 Tax=unclassified Sulfitobacter TaxID=196795 RepID=UPI000B23F172|nr:TRAP transporter fused permease subunit [Sulfitobacter sp. HI0023]